MEPHDPEPREAPPPPSGKPLGASIVIPAFNERHTIGPIIEGLRALPIDHEIVVVDDGSTDGTAEAARAAGATVIRHPYNIGYGASIRKGVRQAARPVVVLMDADAQHDPGDIARLVEHLEGYDMVVAARPWKAKGLFGRAIAITVLSWMASYIAGRRIPDLTSGLRAIRRQVLLPFLRLLPNGFSASTTMTLALLRAGHPVVFVPWETVRPRSTGASKVTPLRDGLRIVLQIVRIVALFSPLRVFLPVSFLLILFGAVRLFTDVFAWTSRADGHFSLFVGILLLFLGLFADHFSYIRRLPRGDD
ncbi:MAG: glycosyltransferase family 2 protein [Deltaproteobacteria bacterium]|nr:glycosyltransferase family 2 protein [Deltaproteobacteria bacterium]